VIVDSCLDERKEQPVALWYLAELGFDPEAVRLIVVTHWDDDHIRGIARLVAACGGADVACSAALAREDVLQFVITQQDVLAGSETGVDELRSVLQLMQRRGDTIIWAKVHTHLFPRPRRAGPSVTALSPSEEAFQRGVTELVERATGIKSAMPRRYRAPEEPNGASVVTSIELKDTSFLLGADLEHSTNPNTGWEALIRHASPPTKAGAVKVPHHGSEGAHHPGMWSELAEHGVLAVLTPMVWGSNDLPGDGDVARVKGLAGRTFRTSEPTLVRSRKGAEVDKMVRGMHGERVRQVRGWGQVRVRGGLDDPTDQWQVELFGDASEIT
jgi:hypothetical protein